MIDGGLRALFREHLPAFHWVTVETGGTGRGIPDSEYCLNGTSAWIEYKLTDAWSVEMRPEQVAFHLRRARAGGRTWIGVRRKHPGGPRRGVAVDELWILRGQFADMIKRSGLPKIQMLDWVPCNLVMPENSHPYFVQAWNGGPARWDWTQIAAILTSG